MGSSGLSNTSLKLTLKWCRAPAVLTVLYYVLLVLASVSSAPPACLGRASALHTGPVVSCGGAPDSVRWSGREVGGTVDGYTERPLPPSPLGTLPSKELALLSPPGTGGSLLATDLLVEETKTSCGWMSFASL